MRKRNVIKYGEFINEEFFKKIFKKKKKDSNNRIDDCVNTIIKFLKENDINDWNDFISVGKFDKYVIDNIIDNSVNSMSELEEVRFRIRLELSDRQQLLDYKKELEDNEEYEKCALIVKKLSER
jgi:hypothetical protein